MLVSLRGKLLKILLKLLGEIEMTLLKKPTIKQIKQMIIKELGPVKEVRDNCKKDGLDDWGCPTYLHLANGIIIFYTGNTNFCNGSKNGYGAGFYARLMHTGYCSDVRLSR